MWGAIERISKDLQELIQRDAGTDGEDEVDPAPTTINLDVAELVLAKIVSTGTPWSWLVDMPEEEEANVKDSVTLGLASKWLGVGGSGGQTMLSVKE